jgi:hypothetical protein
MPSRNEAGANRSKPDAGAPVAGPANELTQPAPALVAAMTTEHFVMQTAISTATSEAAARASIYMYSLSGSLVALGISAQSGPSLMPFVAAILPGIILLGVFTVARLVDISIDHLQARAAIARIHAWYATLGPVAFERFGVRPGQANEVERVPALRFGPLVGGLTTIASMVATINSIVSGAAVTLAALHWLHIPLVGAIAAGAVVVLGLVAGFYAYQEFRLSEAVAGAK